MANIKKVKRNIILNVFPTRDISNYLDNSSNIKKLH